MKIYQIIKNLIQTFGMIEKTFLWVKAAFDKTGYWEYRLKTYN